MKLIIDIPDEVYNFTIQRGHLPYGVNIAGNIIDGEVVEEIEKPFITECREDAIKDNLPLYFVYYEEIGVFEVYVTETRELFEKKRCYKHLPNYAFNNMVNNYLEWYSDWRGIEHEFYK